MHIKACKQYLAYWACILCSIHEHERMYIIHASKTSSVRRQLINIACGVSTAQLKGCVTRYNAIGRNILEGAENRDKTVEVLVLDFKNASTYVSLIIYIYINKKTLWSKFYL